MTTQPAVVIQCYWRSVQPDRRQWKPANPLLEPIDTIIDVPVPLKHEYISNSQAIIQAQLTSEDAPKARLTPRGMRYCIDELEKYMGNDSTGASSVVEVEFSEDDEWETKIEPETSDDENWEETSTDNEPFEDNDEEWET